METHNRSSKLQFYFMFPIYETAVYLLVILYHMHSGSITYANA